MADAMEVPQGGETSQAEGNQLETAADQAMSGELGQPSGKMSNAQAEAFLELELAGKKISLKDRDEALKFIKDGTLMHSDYTRKTQSLAEERKKWEADRDAQTAEMRKVKEKMDGYRKFLNENPHIYEQLERMKGQPLSPSHQAKLAQTQVQEYLSPVQKELAELREWRQQIEAKENREKLYTEMTGEIEGFDRSAVESLMNEYNPREPRDVLRLLHYAHLGQRPPTKPNNEVLLARRQQEKLAARTVPGTGTISRQAGAFGSLEEAEMAALANEQ